MLVLIGAALAVLSQSANGLTDTLNLALVTCGRDTPFFQQWNVTHDQWDEIQLVTPSAHPKCMDIDGYGQDVGNPVWAYPCSQSAQGNEQFTFDGRLLASKSARGMCVGVIFTVEWAPVVLVPCSESKGFANLTLDSHGRFVSAVNSSLCLTGSALSGETCQSASLAHLPYCNSSLPISERVEDLTRRASAIEKIGMLSYQNPGIPRLGVPVNGYGECLHGVRCSCGTPSSLASTGCPTSFPCALLTSASFNRTLFSAIGQTVSTEARALHNQGLVGLNLWAPDVNEFRDPRWGRGQEVPGEDPHLSSVYAYHYVRALQEGDDPRYYKVISTCKHFSAYDLESDGKVSRHSYNAIVPFDDLVDYYWPSFQSCVQEAHAGSIMCSYNAINGTPSCANAHYNNGIVRAEWAFDGFFVSDCNAISNFLPANHNYSATPDDAVRDGLRGGCDVDCGNIYTTSGPNAFLKGTIDLHDVDLAFGRVAHHMIRLGALDNPADQPYTRLTAADVDTPEGRALALSAAEQSIVLLQNHNELLPLLSSARLAVIGPQANATQTLLSNYHGSNTLVDSHSVLQALQARRVPLTYEPALSSVTDTNTTGIAAAARAAAQADVALVLIGLDQSCERESKDRGSLELPGAQLQLVQAVLSANPKTVVVLINGGVVDATWLKPNVPAIVEAFYPGEMGGDAIANVLFGDVNPSGRLPVTYYTNAITQRDKSNMDLASDGGITYMYYDGPVSWPFGFGLSYTTFAYEPVKVPQRVLARPSNDIVFRVRVTNTGNRTGATSVLGFATPPQQRRLPTDRVAPKKKLFAFERTPDLAPGEAIEIDLAASPAVFTRAHQYTPGTYLFRLADVDEPIAVLQMV